MTKDVYIFDIDASGEMPENHRETLTNHLHSLFPNDLSLSEVSNSLCLQNLTVVDTRSNNINMVGWHDGTLTNQYEWCKFDGLLRGNMVKLTYENYIDFQCVVIKYFGFTPYYKYNRNMARKLVEEINEGLAPYTNHRVTFDGFTARVNGYRLFNFININYYSWHLGSYRNQFSWCPFSGVGPLSGNVPLTNLNAPKLKNIVIRYYRERYEFDRGE